MEKHPLHGVINTEIERPPKDIIEAFRRHDACKVADAMARGGVMDHEIKPLQRGMRVCGPAVTVWTRPGDALFILKASDVVQPGDVLVTDAGGQKNLAGTGDGFSSYLKQRGLEGQIIDGGARDTRGIIALGLPTFARASCVAVFGSVGPGAINVPIQCGGVVVQPGDIIIGDDDGVVVVPRASAAAVLRLADEHLAGEQARAEQIRSGRTLVDVQNLNPRVAVWRS
jgi:4-hydroxy-4-methyl-2-oxoglutarate aldolase